jgi:hypothetical protein
VNRRIHLAEYWQHAVSGVSARCGGKFAGAALALGLLSWFGPSFWPILIFVGASSIVYFSELPDRKVLRSSFWLLFALGFLGGVSLNSPDSAIHGPAAVFLALVFGLLVFGWLGLVNSLFGNRSFAYNLLNAAIAALFFVLAFYLVPNFGEDAVFPVILWFFSVFLGSFLLIRESLLFEASIRGSGLRLAAWSFAFILTEVASLVIFLPLGFLNAAALLTLFYILGRDVFLAGFKGLLGFSAVFRELTIFAVILGLIFATVTWVLP